MRKPPKAEGHWLLGSIKEFSNDPLHFVAQNSKDLGEIFILKILQGKLYVTSSPVAMQYVLQGNHKNYTKDKASMQLKLALGNGLLLNEGESWKTQRRLAQPAFYKKRLMGLFEEMGRIADDFCTQLEAHRGQPETVNMLSLMMGVTSRVVLRTLIGSDLEHHLETVEEAITEGQKYLVKRIRKPYTIPFSYLDGSHRKFKQDMNRFDKLIYEVIDNRKAKGEVDSNDLLSMLMSARYDNGEGMSNQQLRDEVVTIFVAGHETSANALTWTFYLLAKHPEIYQKVKAEIREVLDGRLPTFEDIGKLQYLRMVLDESMRLYPPAHSFARQNIAKDELLGYPIKKGTFVFCSIWTLHHRADLWPDPYKFDPERFRPEQVKARSKWHYLPFGAGPRMCIGNNFALMEIVLLLAVMMQRFDFVLDENHPVKAEPLVTLRPKYGLKMWVK